MELEMKCVLMVLPTPAALSAARLGGGTTTLVVSANRNDRASGADVQGMSGSAVLQALEKATAHKRSNKKKMKMKMEKTNQSSGGASPADRPEDVRPLRIDSGWAARLDELEERLTRLSLASSDCTNNKIDAKRSS
ncbi:uncharacterized protein LOC115744405 [Rhodamnia argentea]|uniref:Uncharacterized protein LOC115744405 n=1 Tax=Rhodamnia argentea TaxID=178133 RepID=A0A8B8PM29_9MYRT|nr:uncharacterized protein LOC115744405 [Rhodamnia argentea]